MSAVKDQLAAHSLITGLHVAAAVAAGLRAAVQEWLTDETHRPAVEPHLLSVDALELRLPFTVGDYVDFYASENHATNLGRIFRPHKRNPAQRGFFRTSVQSGQEAGRHSGRG